MVPSWRPLSSALESELGRTSDLAQQSARLLLCAALCVACAGSEPPAKAPAAAEPEPVAAAEPAPAPAAAKSGTDEAWDGEAEATGKKKSEGDAETRTSEVIGQVVRDNRKPFRECYEKGRKELPDLAGTLTLHFVLDPTGKVKKVDLNTERSTIHAPSVVSCATSLFLALKFPPSSRGMESEGNYPFDFKP